MAHSCPDCGAVCHCNEDVGDMILDTKESNLSCVHFKSDPECPGNDFYQEDN